MTFEQRIERFCRRENLSLEWQDCKHGLRRARIETNSFSETDAIRNAIKKMKDVHVDSWTCGAGSFEGYVYVTDAAEQRRADNAQWIETERLESWWQRYHVADAETRRLMACGAIQ